MAERSSRSQALIRITVGLPERALRALPAGLKVVIYRGEHGAGGTCISGAASLRSAGFLGAGSQALDSLAAMI